MILDAGQGEAPLEAEVATALHCDPLLAVLVRWPGASARQATACLRMGAIACLRSDAPPEVAAVLADALQGRERRTRESSVQSWMKRSLETLAVERDTLRSQWLQSSVKLLEMASRAVEAREPLMIGHAFRVAEVAGAMAVVMGRTEEEIEAVRLAGQFHDIGMITVPSTLLIRRGPLTESERELVQQHTVVGSQMVSMHPGLQTVASFVRGHHERWDGLGYPDRLVGEMIPWGARVLAAAEIYDALTAARCYKEQATDTEALARLAKLRGTVIDPTAYLAVSRVIQEHRVLPFLREADAGTLETSMLLDHHTPNGS